MPVWILGSSLFGAQLAAYLGLPYAFASHFAPGALAQALEVYRDTFRPSERWPSRTSCWPSTSSQARTTPRARFLRSSMQQAFANLRTGHPGPLPRPVEGYAERLDPAARAMVDAGAGGLGGRFAGDGRGRLRQLASAIARTR